MSLKLPTGWRSTPATQSVSFSREDESVTVRFRGAPPVQLSAGQYNKTGEFNQAQYGPYPAVVSSSRVTDEAAPVEILQKEHHAFTYPNRIRAGAWDGWVQERGLYFLGERDPKYVDLVQMSDSFDYNPGVKTGALVEAKYGRGRWIYVGLGLRRQLPAGTVGAYQLLANLVSLGKPPRVPQLGDC